ncbi:MAG: Rieske 2Fe-2S domain-containing protein, partial [Gammaproteobacteria bacterium]|nr:Rieske 2Fe-2S domain-containing protein [Gammaproteobacteria bacterium]
YVTEGDQLKPGDSVLYRTPGGATVNVTRQGSAGEAEDFIALSSVCPHLGCQVHWEPQNDRYFCPCHNGTFDRSGKGTGGPPGDANQSLSRFPLKLTKGLLYIEVPVTTLADARGDGRVIERPSGGCGPGHDPCLASREVSPFQPDRKRSEG